MEPTTEPVALWLGVPVPSIQKQETKGPTTRSKISRAATVFSERFRTPTATCLGQGQMCQDSLVGLGPPERTSRSRRGSALLQHRDRGAVLRLRRRRQPCQGRLRLGRQAGCLESLPILWSYLVRVHPGRPAAHPTATGWELGTRSCGPRPPVYNYRGRGTPSHRLGRIHPYVRSCSATGTDRERDRSSAIYSSAHNGTISLKRANGKLSHVLRS